MKTYLFLLTILLACFATTLSTAYAQIPRTFSYQGLITDASGNPISDGNHSLKLGIYTEFSGGGTGLYSETQSNVTVTKGHFSVIVGAVKPFPTDLLDFSRQYYLGISVDGGAELVSRTKLCSAPYSMRAIVSDSLNLPFICYINDPQNDALQIINAGAGAIFASSADGNGIYSKSVNGTAVRASSTKSDGLFAISVSGPGVTAQSTSGTGVTAQSISGTGLSTTSETGNALYSQSGSGSAGQFAIIKATNTADVLTVTTQGTGGAIYATNTGTIPTILAGTSSTGNFAMGVQGVISSTSPGIGSAGVQGFNNGTGSDGYGVFGRHKGSGWGVYGSSEGGGGGVDGFSIGGIGVRGKSITGISGVFEISNTLNTSNALEVTTDGTGSAIKAICTDITGIKPAILGQTSSNANNAVAIQGEIISTTGNNNSAVKGINNGTGFGYGVYGSHAGGGYGVAGKSQIGFGVYGEVKNLGVGVFGAATGAGTGVSAQAEDNGNALVVNMDGTTASTTTLNNCAIFENVGIRVARIDRTGKGYFDGGTQNSGADLAEAFDVPEMRSSYEPGDVLVISQKGERLVEKCSTPYSRLVAGVYATKPGVLLTEENVDSDISGKVPMGVIGVIPTKVCAENGPIAIGDLLVTSSTPGHAMKADLAKVTFEQALGKALQPFSGSGTSIIKVLVNVK